MAEKASQEHGAALAIRKQRGHILYTHGETREKEHKWGQAAQPHSLSLVRCFTQ